MGDHNSKFSHTHCTPNSCAPADHPWKHSHEKDAAQNTKGTDRTAAAGGTQPTAALSQPHSQAAVLLATEPSSSQGDSKLVPHIPDRQGLPLHNTTTGSTEVNFPWHTLAIAIMGASPPL